MRRTLSSGMVAPAGVPKGSCNQLADDIAAMRQTAGNPRAHVEDGAEPIGSTPEAFGLSSEVKC